MGSELPESKNLTYFFFFPSPSANRGVSLPHHPNYPVYPTASHSRKRLSQKLPWFCAAQRKQMTLLGW